MLMNIQTNQKGIAHLGLLLLAIVVIGLAGFAGYKVLGGQNKELTSEQIKADEAKRTGKTTSNENEADIALQNFGLRTLDDVLVSKDALRDYDSRGLKGFYVFGDTLGNNDPRKNPNFEFASVKPGAPVVASIDGVITFIKEQSDSGDSEVMLQPKDGSVWTIGYDHLVKLKVKKGDRVKAGDVLGEPAVQGNGLLRFEIQINKDSGSTLHICPSTLLASSKSTALLAELKTMQEKWNTVAGMNLYNTSQQSPIGCLVKTMTPEAAQGQ